jgi:hypothetical protein
MANKYAEAMHNYGVRALRAAGVPTETYMCRECDYEWMSPSSICWLCGRVTPRQGSASLFDSLTVRNQNNLGMTHTNFEATGLGD